MKSIKRVVVGMVCLLAGVAGAAWQPGLMSGTVTGQSKIGNTYPATTNIVSSPVMAKTLGWGSGINYVYWGQIYLDGSTYNFAESIDDATRLKIDGTVVIDNTSWSQVGTGSIMREAGWYDFEVRFYNGGGGGPVDQNGWGTTKYGFGYNTSGYTGKEAAGYDFPEDDGHASLFRYDDGFGADSVVVSGFPRKIAVEGMSHGYGTSTGFSKGQKAEFSVPGDTQILSDVERATCIGWKLYKINGDTGAREFWREGTGCTVSDYTHPDCQTELEWQWRIEYKVSFVCDGGDVDTNKLWYVEGENATVTFTADAGRALYEWDGDVEAASKTANPLVFTVDGPKSIQARCSTMFQVTTGEELLAAVSVASATDPSVIEIADGDIYLTETLKLTKPITVRGAGIGKTVLKRDSSLTTLRMIRLDNASALVENLSVTNGYCTTGRGAGAYVTAGTVRRCEFYNCHIGGGGTTDWNMGHCVVLVGSNARAIACVIRGIYVRDGQGEALWVESSAVAESCLVCDNTCDTTGRDSAYMVYCSGGTLRGCTIVNNYMGNSVALYNANGNGRIKDCIVYGNRGSIATSGGLGNGFDIAGSISATTIQNTLVTDPGFVDFANKNYALTAGPAVDAALSGTETLALTEVDAAGNQRQVGTAVDIGALECAQSEPACSFIAKKTTVLENDPAILSLYAIGVGDAPEYTVSFGDETVAVVTTETTVEHAYAHSGVYTVTVSVPGVTPKTGMITVKPKNLYVKEGGTGAAPYASEDQAAGYIEDALAEAGDGCTIWLKKGNYTLKTKTPIEVKKSVTIRGATGRPEDVIVTRMSGGSRPFTLGHASAVLADLTVTGGSPQAQNNHGSNVRITSTGGVVTNCIIRNGYNGQATTGGGGLAMAAGLVTHCVISNNYAYERGTGVFIEGGRLENCLICGNYGGADKGHHDDSGTVCVNGTCSIINCTIADNRAERCPSINFMGGSNQKVINCLIFGNKSTAMTDSIIGVYYPSGKASLFTACAAPFQINGNCFTADDLKVNAEYRPMAKSLCRDNATTTGITVPGTDLAGNPRLDEETGKLDIGCYEFHSSGLTASISSNPAMKDGAASGLTPYPITFMAEADGGVVTAYRWFVNGVEQTAETTATFSTNFTVAGTYQVTLGVSDGNQDYAADNTITVKTYPPVLYVNKASTNPVAPYETEATAATFLEDALAAAADGCEIRIAPETYPAKSGEITIGKGVTIRGMGTTPADVVLDRKDVNTAHRILTISHESSLVTGLTVSRGRRTVQGQYGGGVMITGRGGTISNCVVRNCGANGSDAGGGGIMLDVDNALVTHCVVTNCTSANDAPGGYSYVGGNGICLYKGTVRDSLIAFCKQNNDSHYGKVTWPDGAVAIYGGKMINCTVASNVNATCSGIRAHGGKLINTIVSGNLLTTQDAAETAKVLAYGKAKTTTFDHCLADVDVEGKFAVEDPARTFLRPWKGNFRLRAGSKAVDAGDTSAVTSTVDLRGNSRIRNRTVDLGCYEARVGMTIFVK